MTPPAIPDPAGPRARLKAGGPETRAGDGHHHRLVCRSCGRTEDVDCSAGHAPCLTPVRSAGFQVAEAEVVFWGRCPECVRHDSGGRSVTEARHTTNNGGIPVASDDDSLTLGPTARSGRGTTT